MRLGLHSQSSEFCRVNRGDGHRLGFYELQPLNVELDCTHNFNGGRDAEVRSKLHYKCEMLFERSRIYKSRDGRRRLLRSRIASAPSIPAVQPHPADQEESEQNVFEVADLERKMCGTPLRRAAETFIHHRDDEDAIERT